MNVEAKNFRIGNLVSHNGFNGYVYSIEAAQPRKEERFSDKDLVTLFNNGIITLPIDEINPIPLTEQHLIDFGAEIFQTNRKGLQKSYKLARILFDISNSGLIYHASTRKIVPYVHKLQNLIYELKGIELIYTPQK